jgi:curved DNA-binding protein CbpA
MRARRPASPFAVLGLPARQGLADDDVRSAWRRIATATHPDRADGGDPERFAEAAAAYTALRSPFGRAEALADLAGQRPRRGWRAGRPGARWWPLRARARPPGTPPRPVGAGARAHGPHSALAGLGRLWWRACNGRPARLAARIAVAGAVSGGVIAVAGDQPATPALVTGAVTWLALTAGHDLAPPQSGS